MQHNVVENGERASQADIQRPSGEEMLTEASDTGTQWKVKQEAWASGHSEICLQLPNSGKAMGCHDYVWRTAGAGAEGLLVGELGDCHLCR